MRTLICTLLYRCVRRSDKCLPLSTVLWQFYKFTFYFYFFCFCDKTKKLASVWVIHQRNRLCKYVDLHNVGRRISLKWRCLKSVYFRQESSKILVCTLCKSDPSYHSSAPQSRITWRESIPEQFLKAASTISPILLLTWSRLHHYICAVAISPYGRPLHIVHVQLSNFLTARKCKRCDWSTARPQFWDLAFPVCPFC